MSEFREFFQGAISAFVSIGVSDILDILIVAFIIFKLLSMVHTGSTARVAKAIVFLVLLTLVTSVAKMHMLNFILSNILSLGFIALVILFYGMRNVMHIIRRTHSNMLCTVVTCYILTY